MTGINKSVVASSIPFDNATNELTTENVQDVVEEVSLPIVSLQQAKALVVSGSVIYVQYDPLINTDLSGLKMELL